MKDFIAGIPKCELHLHIEGTLEPELRFELARRNGLTLPYADAEALRASYAFDDLPSFLASYYDGMRVLVTEADSTTWRGRTSPAPTSRTCATWRSSSTRRRTPRAACRSAR